MIDRQKDPGGRLAGAGSAVSPGSKVTGSGPEAHRDRDGLGTGDSRGVPVDVEDPGRACPSTRLSDQFVSVIMPAYNEGHHLKENLLETIQLFDKVKCEYEIIVVDDGSRDDTRRQAEEASRLDDRIRCIPLLRNFGKGKALQVGFRHSRGDYIVFLDSDLDLPPRQLIRLFKIMRDENAQVVVGSKRHPESTIEYPWGRRIISRIYFLILWILFDLPLNDTQTGIKIFRREALASTLPYLLCKRYALDVELLANIHHLGNKISEAPVILHFRRNLPLGRIGLSDLYYTGLDTLAIFYRLRLLRYYDRVRSGKLPAPAEELVMARKPSPESVPARH